MNYLKKYRSLSETAKAGIWFVICSFLQKGISFITVPIFTKILTKEEYGTYSLYLSWVQIILIFTSLNLFNGVLDNGLSKFENDRDRFISAMQGLIITSTTIVFGIFGLGHDLIENLFELSPIYILLMFVEMYVKPSILLWSGKQRFEYRYKKLVIITLLESLVNPLLGLLMISLMKDRALARILSVVIVEFVFCSIIMICQFVRGKTFFSKKYWLYGIKLAIPMLPHYLSGTILNQGDRIMIEKMDGVASVAIYSVAYSIGMLIQMFTGAINGAITPWIYESIKNKTTNGIAKTFNGLLCLVAGICICLMTLSPELMLIFGSGEYVQGAYVIPPVAVSVYFIFLYYLFSLPEFYFEKTRFLFIASLGAAILNIILNFFFIRLFGYVAAGYTTLVCYIIYSIGHYLVSKKICGEYMNGVKLFDIKTIIAISSVLIMFGIGINFLFEYQIVRFSILLFGLIIAYVKKEAIIGLFSKKRV